MAEPQRETTHRCGAHPYPASPLEVDLRIARGARPTLLPPSPRADPGAPAREPELQELLGAMLAPRAAARPSAAAVLRHPLFWPGHARLRLLLQLSDALEASEPRPPAHAAALTALEAEALARGWLPWVERVPAELLVEASRRRGYCAGSVRALLRLLRNTWHHTDELSPSPVGALPPREPAGFVDFWCSRFPGLLPAARRHAAALGLAVGAYEATDAPECSAAPREAEGATVLDVARRREGGVEEGGATGGGAVAGEGGGAAEVHDGARDGEEAGEEASEEAGNEDGVCGERRGVREAQAEAMVAEVGSRIPGRFAQPSTELCRSLYCAASEADGGASLCHGERCAFAHAVAELKPTRHRRHPTAAHVADQVALWMVDALPQADRDAADRSADAFKELYRRYCAHARHTAPPHWRPVLLMMQRHRLVEGLVPKAKSLDGWRPGPLLREPS